MWNSNFSVHQVLQKLGCAFLPSGYKTGVNDFDRDQMACKVENIYYLDLHRKKVCQPLFYTWGEIFLNFMCQIIYDILKFISKIAL